MENIEEKYEKLFKGDYRPHWISISTAFAYLLALIDDEMGKEKALKYIDITTPLDSYDIPDDMVLIGSNENLNPEGCPETKHLLKVNHELFKRLMDGSLKCQGKIWEKRREVVCCNSRHYQESYTEDYEFQGEDHEDIETKFWKDVWKKRGLGIQYKQAKIFIEEFDPDLVTDDSTDVSGIYIPSSNDNGRYFAYKEEYVQLQVESQSLLETTEKLFEKFFQKIYNPEETDSSSNPLKKTGENRFFYSAYIGEWIIEFEGKPFKLKSRKKENAVLEKTLQYVLKNSGARVYSWEDLGKIELFGIIDNIKTIEGILAGDTLTIKNFDWDRQDATDYTTIWALIKRIEEIEKKKENIDSDSKKAMIDKEIKSIRKYLSSWTHRGKPKKIRVENDKLIHRIKKRFRDLHDKIPNDQVKFKEHLQKEIIDKWNAEGVVYSSHEKWRTINE